MRRLVTLWFGVVVLEGDRVVSMRPFPPTASEIADRLARMRAGQVLPEEQEAASGGIEVQEARLSSLGPVKPARALTVALPEGVGQDLLRSASLVLARTEAKLQTDRGDRFVAHAVRVMDETTSSMNTLVELLREWYSVHDPEGTRRETDQPAFARRLAASAEGAMAQVAPDALGTAFTASQEKGVRSFAKAVQGLFEQRSQLETLVAAEIKRVAPTLSRVVGDLVAARLVAHAGSLERLAFLPASTIQTLGAEEALFLHLKEGKKPPKHGALFMHALVNQAPPKQRGRIARQLATKASIAARIDHFGGPDAATKAEALVASIDSQLKRIRTAPPPMRRSQPASRHRRGGR